MSRFHCSCGFAIDDPAQFGDHLREVFTPPDDTGTDGQIHNEADEKWFCDAGIAPLAAFVCLCGFATDDVEEFDDHVLRVFTPEDNTGPDGSLHVPIDSATPPRLWIA